LGGWIKLTQQNKLSLKGPLLAEIQSSIDTTRKQDAHKAQKIEQWLNKLEYTFDVLPMESKCFRIWARLMHRETNTALEDAVITATALANELTVVTCNTKDFHRFDVLQLKPFEYGEQ